MSGLGVDDLDKPEGKPDYDRGAGGEPLIPDPETGKIVRHSRSSGAGDVLEEKSGLNNWKTATALIGQAKSPELVASTLASMPYEENKSAFYGKNGLIEKSIQAGRGAYKADLGTAVHAMSERWEQDDSYDPGEPYRSLLEKYSDGLKALGLHSSHIEVAMVNDARKISGTCDRIYSNRWPLIAPDDTVIPPGSFLIGDLKTGSSLEYSLPGYACQLAAYQGGVLFDVELNQRRPEETPDLRADWAIIVHLSVDSGECEFLWVDLEVGRYGLDLAEQVREWRRAWRRKDGYKASCVPVATTGEGVEVPEEPEEPTGRSFRDTARENREANRIDPDDVDNWVSYCRRRLDALKANETAREWMLVRWPEGVLPPKKVGTLEEAKALSDFLDRVEAEHGLPFMEGQPA